jgi:hypothetical protein
MPARTSWRSIPCTLVEQWIGEAEIHVEVLPTDRATGEAAVRATQVTAGLFLDSAWLT